MVTQYPDTLQFDIITGGGTSVDDNGDTVIIPGSKVTIGIKCRFEVNAEGKTFPSNDGEQTAYNWDVFAPLDQQDVPEGIAFEGFDKEGQKFASGVVKRFKRNQMNLSIQV